MKHSRTHYDFLKGKLIQYFYPETKDIPFLSILNLKPNVTTISELKNLKYVYGFKIENLSLITDENEPIRMAEILEVYGVEIAINIMAAQNKNISELRVLAALFAFSCLDVFEGEFCDNKAPRNSIRAALDSAVGLISRTECRKIAIIAGDVAQAVENTKGDIVFCASSAAHAAAAAAIYQDEMCLTMAYRCAKDAFGSEPYAKKILTDIMFHFLNESYVRCQ